MNKKILFISASLFILIGVVIMAKIIIPSKNIYGDIKSETTDNIIDGIEYNEDALKKENEVLYTNDFVIYQQKGGEVSSNINNWLFMLYSNNLTPITVVYDKNSFGRFAYFKITIDSSSLTQWEDIFINIKLDKISLLETYNGSSTIDERTLEIGYTEYYETQLLYSLYEYPKNGVSFASETFVYTNIAPEWATPQYEISSVKDFIGVFKGGITISENFATLEFIVETEAEANNRWFNLAKSFSISLSTSVYNTESINKKTGDNNVYDIDTNELMSESSLIGSTTISTKIATNIIENYSNGKKRFEIEADYNKYYDESGNLVGKLIKVGDVVMPYINKNGIEIPLSKKADGTARQFQVTSNELTMQGTLRQKLQLLEKTT